MKINTLMKACGLGLFAASALQAAEKRPNILFILTDDQAPDTLSAYGNTRCETPNLDKLAEEGVVFTAAHNMGSYTGAVCVPSRHMIMSGRGVWHLPHRCAHNGRYFTKEQLKDKYNLHPTIPTKAPKDLPKNTLGALFNRAGYVTMRTCKKGNSYGAANKQFSIVHDKTARGGTDETGSKWHGDKVMDFLNDREKNGAEKPFFIYYGFSHPHDPRNGTDDMLKKYGATNKYKPGSMVLEKTPSVPQNWLPAHPFNHGHEDIRDEIKVQGIGRNRDVNTIRNETGRDYACVENIDIQIGRVLKKLEAMGELDNTYIFYTADHGISVGRHGLSGKQNLYEHTWRVPYIVKGPGIEAGRRVKGNIYLNDTLSTMCDLAGIEIPDSNEGTSFKSVLDGEKDTIRDVMYGVYCGGTKPGMRAIKKGDWKLIKYDVENGTVRKKQLFNLKDNPYELLPEHQAPDVVAATGHKPGKNQTNLADDPKYADKVKELEKLLLEEMIKHDDPYRLWDQPKK